MEYGHGREGRRGATEPLVLRGALFIGDTHESPALAYPAGGRTKTMILGAQDVATPY